ncbi:hypothetical protein NKR23_g5721 [Pleurostoma richardsiae]|uniref:Uncharacterized protein n=1 Tax=Pleurostoma richardsiae TaxID=41990 RepID=A0AA38RZ29_9PEZI|nr:hypothetical protein NKR23_g5721 [Pleurostoma richardsiae]
MGLPSGWRLLAARLCIVVLLCSDAVRTEAVELTGPPRDHNTHRNTLLVDYVPEHANLNMTTTLSKRDITFNQIAANGVDVIPSVQFLKDLALQYGVTPPRACLFYTGYGADVQREIKQWYACNILNAPRPEPFSNLPPRQAIGCGGNIPDGYFAAIENDMAKVDICEWLEDDGRVIAASRLLQARNSQAMAEVCRGVVYLFAPTTISPWYRPGSVWYEWELPAIIRNPQVTHLVWVNKDVPYSEDPNTGQPTNPALQWTPNQGVGNVPAPRGDDTDDFQDQHPGYQNGVAQLYEQLFIDCSQDNSGGDA